MVTFLSVFYIAELMSTETYLVDAVSTTLFGCRRKHCSYFLRACKWGNKPAISGLNNLSDDVHK